MPPRILSSALALAIAAAAQADQVVISEIMYHPRADWPEFVEVFNNTATVFDVAGWKLSGGVQYEFPDFSSADPAASLLHSFERIVLSEAGPEATRAAYHLPETTRVFGPWKGKLKNGDERITLRDQNGTRVTTVRYADRGLWSPAADGTGHSLVLQDPNRSVDDWRNWRASERPGGTPGLAPVPLRETPAASPEIEVPQGTTLLAYSAPWRFDDRGTNQDARWLEPDFDDSAWSHGPGVLGFGKLQDVEATLKTVVRSNRQFTYYFRTTFQLPPLEATERIALDLLVDDGAVFYLNGREAGRVRMPAGVITNRTPASVNVRHVQEEINGLTLEPPLLVPGTNVLAVEVHQDRVTSSDLFLAARVRVYSPWRTNLVINEIAGAGTGEGFVELFNPGRDPVPLRGWYFTDDARALTKTKFGRELVVPPGGLTAIPFGEVRLGRTNRVTVHLVAPDGKTVVNSARASFADDLRPVGRKPAGGRAWFQFPEPTPNAPNRSADTAVGLRLNEVHLGGDGLDWVEVINSTEDTVSLRGLFLASKRDLSDRTPLQTGLAELTSKGLASGGVKFPVHQGEARVYLVDAAGVVLDGAVWSVSAGGESRQAFPDGSGEWYVASAPSRDQTNQPARNTQVILNEIFYDPPALLTNAPQFIELFNRGASAVDVSRWRLTEGVEFLMPSGTTIAPGGFLVIASSAARLRQIHGGIPVLGDFQGRLRGRGERVRLVDALGNLVDEVDFRSGGDWPVLAHGGGSSLELIHPDLDNARASAWRDSLEENKSSWREYSFSDTYAELSTFGQPADYRELHLHLVGDGHLALRRIGLWRDGTNWLEHADRLAADGSSASGWLAQGNHAATFMTNGELHLVADGHGDNRPNRLEIDCPGLRKGRKYELKFEARWISGLPRLIAQTFDHSFAQSFAIDVPPNLGTPGRTNSVTRPAPRYAPPELAGRRTDSAPPQLDHLLHAPAVPRSTNTVRITVSVASVAPLQSVQLMHRADTAAGDGEWRSTLLEDDGRSSGDAAAGDGTYTAELTEYQTNGALVQFYVQAATSAGVTAVLPRRGADAPAMFVVDDKRVLRDLRTDRFIVSAYDVGSIANGNTEKYGFRHPRHSNHYYNMTYIFNEQEISYGGEMRISGSPWTRGDHLSKGKWKLPDDRPFRDHTKFYYDNDNSYHNRVARYLLYRMGHVVNEGEWIRVIVNQGGASLKEDTEPIGNDFLDRTFKRGSEGELYRIDDEWWFQDNWERTSRDADWGYKGSDNPGRYRTEWMKRTREAEDDFTALIGLFRTYSENRYTQDEIEKLLDPDAILRLAVVRGYISDWDSFTMGRGKNSYLYRRPEDGRFQFFQWDSDLAYNDPNSAFYSGRIQNWIEKPWNKHLFNYYLAELIQVTESPRTTAWLEAEENASASFNVNTNFYLDYFAKRNVTARRTLGRELDRGFAFGTNFVAGFTTTNETITLSGTAPCAALDIRLADHPGVRVRWKTEFTWNFPKVPLRPGENRFRVTAVHGSGRVLGEATASVTRAAP